MKVKGIMFFGVMAAIMMSAGVASAAPKIASQGYVDAGLKKKVDTTKLGDLATTAEMLGMSAEQAANATIADLVVEAATAGLSESDLEDYATKTYADDAALEAAGVVDAKIGTIATTDANPNGTVAGALSEVETTILGVMDDVEAVEGVANTASQNAQAALTAVGDVAQLSSENITDANARKDTVAAINYLAEKTKNVASTEGLNKLEQTVAKHTEQIGDETSGLIADVAGLTTTTGTHTTQIGTLTTDLDTAEGKIGTLETTVGTQGTAITTLQSTVGEHTTAISELQNAGHITMAEVEAKNYLTSANLEGLATTENVATAKQEAITAAAEDATTKAGQALTDANAYTDTEIGKVNTTLADKANAADVYTKQEADVKFNAAIPKPTGACAAESGRCVLSVINVTGPDGVTAAALQWLDVTAPLEDTTTDENTGA